MNEDEYEAIYNGLALLANAITPANASPGHDEFGNHVASLTEAVMGITSGLHKIAEAIEHLADTNEK
jgi:hypothetical protein